MPKVSVIIPTYNREKYVVKAIDSVLCQNFRDYEIIVVDDGSTDNTRDILKRYQDKIKYIYQDNSGVSAARNTGIKFASGEWLAFLDSDDEWESDYLYEQMDGVKKNPGISMQIVDSMLIDLNGKAESYYSLHGTFSEFPGKGYVFINRPLGFVLKKGPWPPAATIIHSEALRKAGLFDPTLTIKEDYDLMVRVALQGPLGLIKKPLVNCYRRHETIECLTNQWVINPIGFRESHEKILEKLKKLEKLERKEVRTVNGLLSANKRAIGNLFLKNGEVKEARNCFKHALLIDPSIASLSKYILSFLPAKANLWLIEDQ